MAPSLRFVSLAKDGGSAKGASTRTTAPTRASAAASGRWSDEHAGRHGRADAGGGPDDSGGDRPAAGAAGWAADRAGHAGADHRRGAISGRRRRSWGDPEGQGDVQGGRGRVCGRGAGSGQHRIAAQIPPSTMPPSAGSGTTTLPAEATTTSTMAGATVGPQPPAAPGLFDVPGRIRKAIDDWFQGLVASAVNPALDLLGHTLLATPRLATGGRARELWLVSLGLADGAYVLLVTIGGVVLLAHESLQVQYSVKEIAPRLVVGAVASNLSFLLARQGIELANAASAALAGQHLDPANVTATIRTLALAPLQPGSLFTTLLVGALVVLAVVLAGTCLVRAMLVVFLVVAGPVMLAAHALPQTEGLARLWWRAMAACLGVQVGQ